MSGVGEQALDVYLYGEIPNSLPVSVPFCRFENARPKLGTADRGLIYDVASGQLLRWNADHWEKNDGTPVRTYPFPQADPRFTDVPRMGAPVTCIPGAWAGFPVPTFTYAWAVDGEFYNGNSTPQFGRNAEELAFMKEGREIRCVVRADQEPATTGIDSPVYHVVSVASDYIRPALPA